MLNLHRDKKIVWREPGRDGKILCDHRQDGNDEVHHEQNWQPYPVDPYSCYMCDHAYIPLNCKPFSLYSSMVTRS